MSEQNYPSLICYPTPVISEKKKRADGVLPRYIAYTFFEAASPDESPRMRFQVCRDPAFPRARYTIACRFSPITKGAFDPDELKFYSFTFEDTMEDGGDEYVDCIVPLPPRYVFRGCYAYIAETVCEDEIYRYEAYDYDIPASAADSLRSLITGGAATDDDVLASSLLMGEDHPADTTEYMDIPTGGLAAVSGKSADEKTSEPAKKTKQNTKKKRFPILPIFLTVFGIAAIIGTYKGVTYGSAYMKYQYTMLSAEAYTQAGKHDQAERLLRTDLADNRFLETYETTLVGILDSLCDEKRYNEAYQIALHAPFETYLQKICVKASDDALAEEDYETAFAYAVLAPEPFGAAILNSAALAAFDEETQTIREDAYAAAQYSDDPLIRQLLLRDVIEEARSKHHFVTAMRTAFSLDEGTESVQMVSDILNEALHYFLDRDDYPSVAAYIHMFSQPLSRYDLALDDVQTMIYKHCVKNNDKNTVFFFAKQFKMDTSSLKIEPGDPVIRNDLDGSYFLLTESQMRSYHTRPIDVFNGLYVVENGTVSYSANGTDVSANGVTSVATNAFCTVFLKNNGTISVIANSIVGSNMTAVQANALAMIAGTSKMKNVVSVAAGEEHIVCLQADGTVSAFGDNTYGQCGTNKWKNIVAIAAGKRFTVGLCADGTLVACGSNKCGQCDVSEYRNVTDIAACNQTTVMRFSDGTVHIQGEGSMGLADANRLSDINRIRAGATAILAEKNDGTLTLCGTGITGNYGNVSSWKNVKDFAVGDLCLACINANGKTVTVGSTRVK